MGLKDIRKNSQKGDFLTLKSGDKVKLRILSAEPHANYSIFSNDVNEGANVPEGYAFEAPLRARLQHVFVVFNLETKALQILKVSQTTAEKLLETYDAYHETWDFDFQFSRKGAGFNDTEYFAVVIPTEFDPAMMANLSIPDLEKIFSISDDAQIARVIPGAMKNAVEAANKKAEEKAAKKAAKDKKAGLPPAAEKPATPPPAKAPTPPPAAPAAVEEPEMKLEEAAEAPTHAPVGVIVDLRTEEDKKCSKCKVVREIKQGNVKNIDPKSKLPWGQVKVAVCKPCNSMTIIEKLAEPVAA